MTRSELLERAKPILFNTEMVRAIQDGTKTVTRRVIKPQPKSKLSYTFAGEGVGKWSYPDENAYKSWGDEFKHSTNITGEDLEKSWTPPCHTGDILYVRETWFYEEHMHDVTAGEPDLPSGRYSFRYIYKADNPDYPVDVGVGAYGWRASIHMPKEAARIFLRVTGVRVERLQNITDEDILREGIYKSLNPYMDCYDYVYESSPKRWFSSQRHCFAYGLWDSTVKKSDLDCYGWGANPWVWVIEFERVEVIDD